MNALESTVMSKFLSPAFSTSKGICVQVGDNATDSVILYPKWGCNAVGIHGKTAHPDDGSPAYVVFFPWSTVRSVTA